MAMDPRRGAQVQTTYPARDDRHNRWSSPYQEGMNPRKRPATNSNARGYTPEKRVRPEDKSRRPNDHYASPNSPRSPPKGPSNLVPRSNTTPGGRPPTGPAGKTFRTQKGGEIDSYRPDGLQNRWESSTQASKSSVDARGALTPNTVMSPASLNGEMSGSSRSTPTPGQVAPLGPSMTPSTLGPPQSLTVLSPLDENGSGVQEIEVLTAAVAARQAYLNAEEHLKLLEKESDTFPVAAKTRRTLKAKQDRDASQKKYHLTMKNFQASGIQFGIHSMTEAKRNTSGPSQGGVGDADIAELRKEVKELQEERKAVAEGMEQTIREQVRVAIEAHMKSLMPGYAKGNLEEEPKGEGRGTQDMINRSMRGTLKECRSDISAVPAALIETVENLKSSVDTLQDQVTALKTANNKLVSWGNFQELRDLVDNHDNDLRRIDDNQINDFGLLKKLNQDIEGEDGLYERIASLRRFRERVEEGTDNSERIQELEERIRGEADSIRQDLDSVNEHIQRQGTAVEQLPKIQSEVDVCKTRLAKAEIDVEKALDSVLTPEQITKIAQEAVQEKDQTIVSELKAINDKLEATTTVTQGLESRFETFQNENTHIGTQLRDEFAKWQYAKDNAITEKYAQATAEASKLHGEATSEAKKLHVQATEEAKSLQSQTLAQVKEMVGQVKMELADMAKKCEDSATHAANKRLDVIEGRCKTLEAFKEEQQKAQRDLGQSTLTVQNECGTGLACDTPATSSDMTISIMTERLDNLETFVKSVNEGLEATEQKVGTHQAELEGIQTAVVAAANGSTQNRLYAFQNEELGPWQTGVEIRFQAIEANLAAYEREITEEKQKVFTLAEAVHNKVPSAEVPKPSSISNTSNGRTANSRSAQQAGSIQALREEMNALFNGWNASFQKSHMTLQQNISYAIDQCNIAKTAIQNLEQRYEQITTDYIYQCMVSRIQQMYPDAPAFLQQLGTLRNELASFDQARLNPLELRVHKMETEYETVSQKVDVQNPRFDEVDEKMSYLQNQINDMLLGGVDPQKDALPTQEGAQLVERLGALETKVDTKINTFEQSLSDERTARVKDNAAITDSAIKEKQDLDSAIGENKNALQALKESFDTGNNRILAIENTASKIEDLDSKIETINTTVIEHGTRFGAIEGRIVAAMEVISFKPEIEDYLARWPNTLDELSTIKSAVKRMNDQQPRPVKVLWPADKENPDDGKENTNKEMQEESSSREPPRKTLKRRHGVESY